MSSLVIDNWESEAGLKELDRIAYTSLDFILKVWQREGAAALLNGTDVLLLVATGSGKSCLFYLYALARPNDIVFVVSPLKMLEKNMVSSLDGKGFKAVALNADSVLEYREAGRDVWDECAQGDYQIILCSPEQLSSPEMVALLDRKEFQRRVGLVVADEAHLIPIWGGNGNGRPFRSAFNAIGNLRSQLSPQTVFLGLSATLMPGQPQSTVEERLGFDKLKYKILKLDCERKNLYVIFRRILHAFTQDDFSDLDWVVPISVTEAKDIKKTVIYVDNVMQGHSLVAYLRRLLPPVLQAKAGRIIRHLHSATCSRCKYEALDDFLDPDGDELRIIVATEAFGCGVDIPDIYQVINFGTPLTLDALFQRLGRAGRCIPFGFGYVYVNPRLWDLMAKRVSGLVERSRPKRAKKTQAGPEGSVDATEDKKDDEPRCCEHFKKVLEAHLKGECITRCISLIYKDPSSDTKPNQCTRCNSCVEDQIPSPREQSRRANPSQSHSIEDCADPIPHIPLKGLGKPSKDMLDKVRSQIATVIQDIYLSVPPTPSQRPFGGIKSFVPTNTTAFLAKRILDLCTVELIQLALGKNWAFWDTHGLELADGLLVIRGNLQQELELRKTEGGLKRSRIQKKTSERVPEPEDDERAESEDLDASQPAAAARMTTLVRSGTSKASGSRKRRAEE